MLQSEIDDHNRAKRYSVGFVENAQTWGYYSVGIWLILYWIMGDSFHWSYPVIHLLLANINDSWWGRVYRAHQNMDSSEVEWHEYYVLADANGDSMRFDELRWKHAEVMGYVAREMMNRYGVDTYPP